MQDTVGWRRLMHWSSHYNKGPSKEPCSHILPRVTHGITWALSPSRNWGVGMGTCLELAWLWEQRDSSCSCDGAACLGHVFPGKYTVQRKNTSDRKGTQTIMFFWNVLTGGTQQNSFPGKCSTSFTLDMLLWVLHNPRQAAAILKKKIHIPPHIEVLLVVLEGFFSSWCWAMQGELWHITHKLLSCHSAVL